MRLRGQAELFYFIDGIKNEHWWLVYGSGQSITRTAEILNMTPGAAGRILSKWRGKGEGYKDEQLLEWKQLLKSKG